MKSPYQQFIFEAYNFDPTNRTLTLQYSFDSTVPFTETFHFDFGFVDYDPVQLDRACQNVFFMAGVSYYKAYVAPEIRIKQGELDPQSAAFFSKTYQQGLGEFFFVNKLDPRTPIHFPHTLPTLQQIPAASTNTGLLVGVGGGKDSLVSVEMLRGKEDVATWSVGHRPQLTPLIERIGLPHYWVERTWDRSLLDHNQRGALNGHVPISAILATVGVVVAILTGRHDVVVSNEQSANEPTLHYEGVAVNHQYSKSLTFEQDFQQVLTAMFGDALRYYSFLRPLSEVYIAELFAHIGFTTYHDVFSSCNRAFTHDSHRLFWDGTCPKCAFVFLALTPFVDAEALANLFHGKNLLLDPALEPTYRQLLGIQGDKPLECVGEIKESRAAMILAAEIYPSLKTTYQFDIPADYNYQTLGSHSMPPTIFEHLCAHLLT